MLIGRSSALFDRALAWLLAAKVVLPGLSVLERAIARVRARVHHHLHARLVDRLTPEHRERLDGLGFDSIILRLWGVW